MLVHAHRERVPTVPCSSNPQVGSVPLQIPVSASVAAVPFCQLSIYFGFGLSLWAKHDGPDGCDPGSVMRLLSSPGDRSTGRSGRSRYQSSFEFTILDGDMGRGEGPVQL